MFPLRRSTVFGTAAGALLLVTLVLGALTPAGATPQAATKAPAGLGAKADFERFRHEKDGWKILSDPVVKRLLKQTMGNRALGFWGSAQMAEQPVVSGDELLVGAYVRGVAPWMRSAFGLNLATGKCYAAYIDGNDLHVFGAASMDQLPPLFRSYLKEKVEAKKVLFEKADWTPPRTTRARTTRRPLNLASPTGTYTREGGTRFVSATLQVLALPGGKIAFDLAGANGGNTGEAEGTMKLANNRARYSQDGAGTLDFQFKGARVIVSGDDQSYCGMGVTLTGTFVKTADKPPPGLK